jgi:ABC-type multidrug transport system fused ATPase/permease subunit
MTVLSGTATTISLCDLASVQVPVLFTGSIRENLAPFGGHCDAALWSALRRAHLAPVVEGWEREGLGGLDYQLGEGGSPLSAGQKQLLALAHALLNPAKVTGRGSCRCWGFSCR